MEQDQPPCLVRVAVPVPRLPVLTYKVPSRWEPLAQVGSRVRVRVGNRRLIGTIFERTQDAPEGITLRDLDEVLDLAPIVEPELLELASFGSSYYMAPIGEVVSALVPSGIRSWGARKVRVTSAGAMSLGLDPGDALLVQHLLENGPMTIAELHTATKERVDATEDKDAPTPLAVRLERLQNAGKVSIEATRRARGARYKSAVELPPGNLDEQLQACGRSPKARAVVEHLNTLGRPATDQEVCAEVSCSSAVITRLVKRGVLRRFTQIESVSLARHQLSRKAPSGEPQSPHKKFVLRPDQAEALEQVQGALESRTYRTFLLAGMTGSGKTEVYLRATETALAQGRSAILLVPEIALVPALARQVRERFGDDLAILHSNLATAERSQEWERIREHRARVVLGPRSAVFAPVRSLGLIVVDEEHDTAYKQEIAPRYHGRDLALVRAQRMGAVALVASATPSLETRHNVDRERYGLLELTERVGQGALPEGILVDLRKEPVMKKPGDVVFSQRLQAEIEHNLKRGEQIILLRNRRGYAPMLLCRACGQDHRCEDCGLPMTFHQRAERLECHYCGAKRSAPRQCESCDELALEPIGTGTERVEERFKKRFPNVPVAVLDRDTSRRTGGAAAVLEQFSRGATQVLIGTQMVAKGHHFPGVTLTGVLAADSYLGFPDFRAVEKTYALLVQLAGRAGRGDKPGRVVVQTYNPEHYAIRAALEHEDRAFAAEEMAFRRTFLYPPYSRMVQLLLRDKQQARGQERVLQIARALQQHPLANQVRIQGPAPAPLERLKGMWRFQLLVRGPSSQALRKLVREAVLPLGLADLTIDVDPYSLL